MTQVKFKVDQHDGNYEATKITMQFTYPDLTKDALLLARYEGTNLMEDQGLDSWCRVDPEGRIEEIGSGLKAVVYLEAGHYCAAIKIPDTLYESWEFDVHPVPITKLKTPWFHRFSDGKKFEIPELRSSN
jgi:hypothetical protein